MEYDGKWYRCRVKEIPAMDGASAIVVLFDVGITIPMVRADQLHRLENRHVSEPDLSLHCRLWGVKPAGHLTQWSRTSLEKMMQMLKTAEKLFVQIYSKCLHYFIIS